MNLVERIFDPLFGRWMASRLRLHVAGLVEDTLRDVPVVYCANHESWWDGFILRALHRRMRPTAPFRAVMLDEELRKHRILKALGGLGIEVGSVASGRRLLRELRSLPSSTGVAFFPQGRLRPADPRPLGFRPGLRNVLKALSPAVLLPIGIRILPGKDHRMDAFVSVGHAMPILDPALPPMAEIESAVTGELNAINSFVARLEEDAAEFWPHAADMLPREPGGAWLPQTDLLPFSEN